MNISIIASRYAKAFFEFGKEKNNLALLKKDAELIYDTFQEAEDITILFQNPVIKESVKKQIFDKVFEKRIKPESLQFIHLLIQNNRELYINDVLRNFLGLYRKHEGIKKVVITTASPIDNEIRKKLEKDITEYLKCKIEMEEFINEQIIGGYVIRIEDQQIDKSIATQLKYIHKTLVNTSVN